MGQCGCGDVYIENAYELPGGQVVAYDIYQGCRDCFSGPGLNIYVYPNRKSEWLETAKIESFQPDQFGGARGAGISVGLFEVADLISEAKELTEIGSIGEGPEDYANLGDWLDDFGLELIQGAMRRFHERMKLKGQDEKATE